MSRLSGGLTLAVFAIFSAILGAADSPALRGVRLLKGEAVAGENGDSGNMGRPVLGYVVHSAPPDLRAILGVPGAAVFSDPLSLPRGVTRVLFSPGQRYALVERGYGLESVSRPPRARSEPVTELAVLSLTGARRGQIVAIAGGLPAADLVGFSPSGRSVVLYSRGAERLQLITGLPEEPRIVQDLEAATLSESPEAAAVSDEAGSLLLASSRAVYSFSPGGSTRLVLPVAGVPSLAFLPNSENGAIADRSAGTIYLFQSSTSTVTGRVLATGLDGLGEMLSSADGQSLFVTNPNGNGVWQVMVLTGEVRAFDVGISPTRLDPLLNTDTFLISSEPGRPAWIFLGKRDAARAVFVPAPTPGGLHSF
jgi:hypothetical protein